MLFSYGSGQQQIDNNENAGKLLAISIAVQMRRCNAGHITRWSTSRASLEATRCRHRSNACAVLPRRPLWSTNLNEKHKTLTKLNF
jgi:hypothetical protein